MQHQVVIAQQLIDTTADVKGNHHPLARARFGLGQLRVGELEGDIGAGGGGAGAHYQYLYGQSASLAGQPVVLRGRVVKFTPNIMGTNWLHIQDGTGSQGTHDLTVTTSATVQVGDMVVVKGAVTANKDFGAGYAFPVLVEDATIAAE